MTKLRSNLNRSTVPLRPFEEKRSRQKASIHARFLLDALARNPKNHGRWIVVLIDCPRSSLEGEYSVVSVAKKAAGRRAAEFVEDGMVCGLGTGSTIAFALERLAERVRDEKLRFCGVPTSLDTERKAKELGFELRTLEEAPRLDLTIDGADEVDPNVCLTKGGGGALLREKVVAEASAREVICITNSKCVERLGITFPLPVEVIPFARHVVARQIERLGATCRTRMTSGKPVLTDNGNEILDCTFSEGIEKPDLMDVVLNGIAGVVENGLFVDLAHVLVIAGEPADKGNEGQVEIRER